MDFKTTTVHFIESDLGLSIGINKNFPIFVKNLDEAFYIIKNLFEKQAEQPPLIKYIVRYTFGEWRSFLGSRKKYYQKIIQATSKDEAMKKLREYFDYNHYLVITSVKKKRVKHKKENQ